MQVLEIETRTDGYDYGPKIVELKLAAEVVVLKMKNLYDDFISDFWFWVGAQNCLFLGFSSI